jgi:hypothetical protein
VFFLTGMSITIVEQELFDSVAFRSKILNHQELVLLGLTKEIHQVFTVHCFSI